MSFKKFTFKKWHCFIICLAILLPLIIFAAGQYYSLAVMQIVYPRQSDGTLGNAGLCFLNHGSNDYFIPNNTQAEILAWLDHLPSDVSQPVCCADGICNLAGGENGSNCPNDCSSVLCGDGTCSNSERCACAADCPVCVDGCANYNDFATGPALPDCESQGCFQEPGDLSSKKCVATECHALTETNCEVAGSVTTGCFWNPGTGQQGAGNPGCHYNDWTKYTDMNECNYDGYTWYVNGSTSNRCYVNDDTACYCAP